MSEVEKKKAIRHQLDDLEKSISALSGVIGDLHSRLEPILSKEPETGCDVAPADSTCPMSDEISGFVIRTNGMADLIRRLHDRLEI